ncbi:DNA-binding response regulator, NarL/FixJ family, contains REC and HTH domains [Streptomyces sp. OV198]|jgi:DNA-binding NarL/FixJ family response regulator|uniref:LuxR C-terminal-related transcriptional regulator n=1 Tax=unclassified Streptomyces TaxID=2593676 RepID=UPI000BB1316C|nr:MULTISPECIES: response regulator transcription factor [unclassified Streptomyces]PBD01809.1 DNA-binding NarL/FixJ family response regulator [Streptomyces sp. Ag82_O1-15]SOE79280.1 DNA-binding response regulator, NarL/FixJ family, contains REC and HTH domains [Streptomyces sp. OV198]
MTSVLVVHSQSLHRLGLHMLLAAEPDLTVVGEATSGAEAVRMSAALGPDVVVMGTHAADPNGVEAIRRMTRPLTPLPTPEPVTAGGRPPRVLVLTPSGHEGYAYAALRAGAGGFLPQDATPDELTAAVRIVAAGDAVTTPSVTRALIDAVRQERPARTAEQETGLDMLTERERDVLTAVASGWSNAEIAARLSIAPTTVKSHVSHILAKIGARARVQAVAFAYESGLVRPAA